MLSLSRAAFVAAAVLLLLLIGAVAWGASLQAELDSIRADEPRSPAPRSAAPDESAQPAASALPTGTVTEPSSGAEELGGAVWYPGTDAAAYALVAAEDSSSENRNRADFAVSGSADDEINAALASLSDIGGGQVTLLEGTYELDSPITIDGNGLALVGVNVGNGAGYAIEATGSKIVPSDQFPEGDFLIRTSADAYGPMVSLLHLDGLDRAQGMSVESQRPTITLNAVTQAGGTGMLFSGESVGNRPYDGYVLFNRVFDGSGIGIHHASRSGDMLIEGNIVFRNEDDGFRCEGASQMYRVNHAYNNGGMGLRIIPGCVRTRLSSNKWEGNRLGGVSIEGGSGFTIVGDTFAHNEANQPDAGAQLQVGVRGDRPTIGVMLWGLSFGKGDDDNPNLVHVGTLGQEVDIGPVYSNGGYTSDPFRIEGEDVRFYDAVVDPIIDGTN